MEKESPNHTDAFLCGSLWEEHVIQHQIKIADGLIGILPPQHVIAQLDTRHAIYADYGPLKAKVGHAIKVVGSHIISHSTIWKVWVVSHHLSMRHYAKVALADFSRRRPMIGSKLAL